MKLRKRQKGKTATALDTLAGVTKIWTELQISKKAGKGVAKAASLKPKRPSRLRRIVRSTPVKLAGAAAVVGGVGAALAKKLKGSGPEPIYTPPPPGEPVAPPDVAPPLAVAPEPATPTDATSPLGTREPAIGEAGLSSATIDTAADDAPADEPVAVEDAVAEEPEAAAAGAFADADADSGATLDETASAAGTIALVEDEATIADDEVAAEPPDASADEADDDAGATAADLSADTAEDEDEIRRR
jgi:ubiquinol-cytochrome c reductase cytochrome c1 subunit